VKLVKVFLLAMVLGGAGGVLGSIVGNAFGKGGLITGGVILGALFAGAAGYVSASRGWVARGQRIWTIVGGVAGFLLACVVALATLSSPIGPILSTLMIGSGAVLGAVVGRDPHEQT